MMQIRPTAENMESFSLWRLIIVRTASRSLRTDAFVFIMLIGLAEFLTGKMSENIEGQGHEHQHQAGGKNTLIADTAVREVAHGDLYDIGGDGGSRIHRIESQVGLLAGGD